MPLLLRLVIFLAVRLCLGAVAARVRWAPALGRTITHLLSSCVIRLPTIFVAVAGYAWAHIRKKE